MLGAPQTAAHHMLRRSQLRLCNRTGLVLWEVTFPSAVSRSPVTCKAITEGSETNYQACMQGEQEMG